MNTTVYAQDLEKDLQEVFKPLLVKVKMVGEKFQFHVSGPVKHHQLQHVMNIGETEVLRSGAGITVSVKPNDA